MIYDLAFQPDISLSKILLGKFKLKKAQKSPTVEENQMHSDIVQVF